MALSDKRRIVLRERRHAGFGPAGAIGGRSAVERMPGGAAHTYGIAFTGRFAVYAGVKARELLERHGEA